MLKKIYFGDKLLVLTDTRNESLPGLIPGGEAEVWENAEEQEFLRAVRSMESPHSKGIVWFHDRASDHFRLLRQELELIQAAGGFVYTPEEEILFIFRRGKWDLPKGKLDEGETLEAAAVREVQEETGISALRLVKPLVITYHTYYQDGRHILKESHWYLMEGTREALVPQEDEDIEQCVWIPRSEALQYRAGSHGSIGDVIDAGLLYLEQRG